MNDEYFEVLPLFSSPVGIIDITNDLSELNRIISDYDFVRTNQVGSKDTYVTTTLKILDNFPYTEDVLIGYFNSYKNNVLRLEDTNFRLTTSWGTKTDPKGFSQFHKHKNCVYSGILYFEDVEDGKLEFCFDNLPEQILLNKPSEWNVYNSKSWFITPRKNMIVFFPSYLSHRVTVNESSKPRYSLAFNMFPEGFIGTGDSSIDIKIQ